MLTIVDARRRLHAALAPWCMGLGFDIALALDDASGHGPDVAIDATVTPKTRNSCAGLEGLGIGGLLGGVDLRFCAMLVGSVSECSSDADDKGHGKNDAAICGGAEALLPRSTSTDCKVERNYLGLLSFKCSFSCHLATTINATNICVKCT